MKKHNGKWRACIDFSIFNQVCHKNKFSLPRIGQFADFTTRHELMSFMDAYSGDNQIFMHPSDKDNTSFITDKGLFCYRMMLFGLKMMGYLSKTC